MEGEKGSADHPEPRDTFKIAYIIHFLLGAGNLLPWNAFITAIDYFGYLYPTKHIEKVFSVAYMSSSVLVLVIVMSWGGWSKQLGYRLRMNMGFCMFILSLMVAPVIDWSWSSSGPKGSSNGAYGVTVASVVVCGIADGLIGGSLIGAAGKLPKQYMQAVFAGTASSGNIILQLLTSLLISSMLQQLSSKCDEAYSLFPKCSHFHLEDYNKGITPPESSRSPNECPLLLHNFTGKSLTAIHVLKSIKKATWVCILRLVFYPLFAACLNGPKWLKTEVTVAALTFMLGVTNGYLTSVLMILTPKSVSVSESELSAILMVVSLGIGLVGGSIIGWFWVI
ncbi:hypothetical protein D5086_012354 [Populus alba]|uniref:Uncharacterized protein n=1 Tax=Populus alba TaxID=43335 RepID=A0ACC4C2P5_POPAL